MDQSAYLNSHSAKTSLHLVVDDWLDNINDIQITGVCLLDISKCFYTISNHTLLQKLGMYAIKHTELEWFSSYLGKRKQAVFCHNKLSSLVDITAAVPQGSVRGPFSFLLYINDTSNFSLDKCLPITELHIITKVPVTIFEVCGASREWDFLRDGGQTATESISVINWDWHHRRLRIRLGLADVIRIAKPITNGMGMHIDPF